MKRTLEYAPPTRPANRWIRSAVCGLVVALPLLGGMAIALDRLFPAAKPAPLARPVDLGVAATTRPAVEPPPSPPPPLFDVERVRDASVRPNLELLRNRNDAAARRAAQRVRAHFDQARAGADLFARSIIGPFDSMKTLYLMGKGAVLRRWRRDATIDRLRDHVTWNYQRHVTSGPKMEAAVRAALMQFESDLRANRNEALQAITRDIAAEALPVVVVIDQEKIARRCDAEVRDAVAALMDQKVAEQAAVGSLQTVAVTEGLSIAATYLVSRVVVVRLAAIPLSAAAGGCGAGATVGSAVPGLGTAAGAATGILVGLAVDTYLSSRQIRKVTNSVRDVLTTTEQALLHGHDGAAGLDRIFEHALSTQGAAIDRLIADELRIAAMPAERNGS